MVIDFVKENSVSIIIVVCVIIGLLVLFSLLGINFEDSNKKKISKIITIETIDNFNTPMNDSFCNTYKSNPSKLNKKCKELTNNNCMNINCCILANGKKILDELKWEGVAMVEFKKDNSTGMYNLMEINAKFWGSLDLALVCGADFPGLMIDSALGKEIVPWTYKYKRFHTRCIS